MHEYPDAPGYRDDIASMEAAAQVKGKAANIRNQLLAMFRLGWTGTSYQAAAFLDIPYHSVQPRFSELYRMGHIIKHQLVPGPNGPRIWQWKLAPHERSNANG